MHPTLSSGNHMQRDSAEGPRDVLPALRRFARAPVRTERCELCGAAISTPHPHLLERSSRKVVCACRACALLFCGQEAAKFLRVPERVRRLNSFSLSDAEWAAMMLPIGMAFFIRGAEGSTTALYPSPAGAMESLIALPSWSELTHNDPVLAEAESEVEALLVNRVSEPHACLLVPIDQAYALVGLIRSQWHGLSGGTEVWRAIAEFFAVLERKARPVGEVNHA